MLNFIIKTIVGTIVGTITYTALTIGGMLLFYDKIVNWVMKKTIKSMSIDDEDFDIDDALSNLLV